MEYQRTVSIYIVSNDGKVLFIKHPKFNVWLPPGGHVESGESSWNALRREVLEEIAYDIGDGIVKTLDSRAIQVRHPYFVQLEDHGNGKHVESQLFLAFLDTMPDLVSPEGLEIRWFNTQEVMDSKKVFENTKAHIRTIVSRFI